MANTTDFYSYPKRTVYLSSDMETAIPDTLVPLTFNVPIETDDSVILDFGRTERLTHIYFKHKFVSSIQVFAMSGVSATGGTPVEFTDGARQATLLPSGVYAFNTRVDTQYLRVVPTPAGSGAIQLQALVAVELLVRFQDGAFNRIGYTPQQRTRGHHKMLSGGMRPYQGLGIMKRKMNFGSEQIPYSYIAKHREAAADDYLDLGTSAEPRYFNPDGHDAIFAEADIKRINTLFQEHLEFIFSDCLDEYPDRIFRASFQENEFDEPFSDKWKRLGYDVGFTVCEV